MNTLYIDTETTGLKPTTSHVVEIAIVDDTGKTVMDTLVNPGSPIPPDATKIHGITDADVASSPMLAELLPTILKLVNGEQVVIYNAAYDTQFLPGLTTSAAFVQCAMNRAQKAMRMDRWPKLTAAAEWSGYQWQGNAHRALADSLAARHVWLHMDERDGPGMQFLPVRSSNVHAVAYDLATKLLAVRFSSFECYHYFDVPPERHAALMESASPGKYFGAQIRPAFKFKKVAA